MCDAYKQQTPVSDLFIFETFIHEAIDNLDLETKTGPHVTTAKRTNSFRSSRIRFRRRCRYICMIASPTIDNPLFILTLDSRLSSL